MSKRPESPTRLRADFRWRGSTCLTITAASLAAGHYKLGQLLGEVIRRVAGQRLAATGRRKFAQQIALARRCRKLLTDKAATANSDRHARIFAGIHEYFHCLNLWAFGAELNRCAETCPQVDGAAVTAEDLAFWLQDDNTGCQTGLLRMPGGRVLFWHTEEDTIGYLDQPRIAHFAVGGEAWHACLYPYLLPGPAFGWRQGYFHAVDSLCLRRRVSDAGCPSGVASWLIWRLAGEVAAKDILAACTPYVDGCAINVIHVGEAGPKRVAAITHEFGRGRICSRSLPARGGAWQFQANAVSDEALQLQSYEAHSPRQRKPYCARAERTADFIAAMLADGDESPQRILEMLASRRGGEYAYANDDVKSHCVGIAAWGKLELYAAPGSAQPGDVYRPQFFA